MTNQQTDARQLQQQEQQQADLIANNENNCQSLNLQLGTAIGHIPMLNTGNDPQMAILNGTGNINSNGGNTQALSGQQLQQQQQQQSIVGATEDLRYHGTELVMLYDYKVILLHSETHHRNDVLKPAATENHQKINPNSNIWSLIEKESLIKILILHRFCKIIEFIFIL